MSDRCVIVAGGDCTTFELQSICENDYIIAADSGLKVLNENSIIPHLIVGDFDSYDGKLPKDVDIIKLPTKKNDTDLLFAARQGVEKGFGDFLILGGYGSRPDQNFAMYQTLLWLAEQDATALAECCGFTATAVNNSKISFNVADDEYLSVFSFAGVSSGVHIKNADYPLENATLYPDFPVGVSNCKSGGGEVTVSVKNGTLLVFKLKKNI